MASKHQGLNVPCKLIQEFKRTAYFTATLFIHYQWQVLDENDTY